MRVFVAFAALVFAVPAQAEWYQASTEHFLIYSEQKPQALRQFGEELERFDAAVRILRKMPDQPPSPGNRLTIFDISAAKVQQLYGDKSGFVQGFYHGSAGESAAFVSSTDSAAANRQTETGSILPKTSDWEMRDDTVLLHEYSHHLMMQELASPYPQWLVEGFAELLSTAAFDRDGSVSIGLSANHRYAGLLYGKQLSLEDLFTSNFDHITNEQEESLYGRGWLLTHYLTFEPSRAGQLQTYVAALSKGVEPLTAARQAFGDLNALNHDLEAYLNRSKLQYLKIPGSMLKIGPVEITKLTPGAAAALPIAMELKKGVDADSAQQVAGEARAVEASYRGDPLVETDLAAAELDAGDYAAAEAAADRALAANPKMTKAMIVKGRAKTEALEKAKGTSSAFADARSWFLNANKIDPEDPEPLYYFYRSFVREGIAPTRNAIAALHYASDLAPQDEGLRLTSAGQYLADNAAKDARSALVPLAYSPHGGKAAEMARSIIARIDAGDTGGALKQAGWTRSSNAGS